MRILIGKSRDLKSSANFRTDANELTSNSRTSKGADGVSFNISSFTASPFLMFRTAMMICPPRFANTRAVSFPIPAVAPVRPIRKISRQIFSLSLSLSISNKFHKNLYTPSSHIPARKRTKQIMNLISTTRSCKIRVRNVYIAHAGSR